LTEEDAVRDREMWQQAIEPQEAERSGVLLLSFPPETGGGATVDGKNEANVRKYRMLSSIYDWFARNPFLERPRRRQFELADIQPGNRVLIVGVGTGLDLAHTSAEAKVTGIDLSADMLRRAKLKAGHRDCSLRQMNAEQLDFDDESFDVVIMNCVLSVVADPAKALSEAARVLAPSGSIWILGKFYETAPGTSRRALSWVLTAIGGADLTRSLNNAIGTTPLRIVRHEQDRLVDIFELTPADEALERQ
jgi:phosphatidylethanolamine/phosphatidyl-N-methylethanolamine N-methyltransferase